MAHIIKLSNGTKIGSGAGESRVIKSCDVTEQVNADQELTLGSTCSACMEVEIIVHSGSLGMSAGNEVVLYRDGVQVGVFTLEKPTRTSDKGYQITAFDHVAKLDKNLSGWLKGLTGWPYTLIEFAGMVCQACGLELATNKIPNGDMQVREFFVANVTGRQLLRWVGELACRFCRADEQGRIVLEWYRDSDVVITPGGERFYYSGGLSYEDYEVAAVDAVKVQLADSDQGALWPEGAAGNAYVIVGNPLVQVDSALEGKLEVIRQELAAMPVYRPCTAEIPAGEDIRAGDVVTVEGRNGMQFRSCVMRRTVKGQRQMLECTGSVNRSSTVAVNGRSVAQLAQDVVDRQNQAYIFNKLTDGGKIQGIYYRDGKWYINAQVAKIVDLTADQVTAGKLQSADGKTYFDLDAGAIVAKSSEGYEVTLTDGAISVRDEDGAARVLVSRYSGGYCIYLTADSGLICGFSTEGDNFYLVAPNGDGSGVIGYRPCWKTIDGNVVLTKY